MIHQPSNMLPSPFNGDGMGVIDATNDNSFSANINGDLPILAYQLIIYKNTVDNEVVYDTTKVILPEPFYYFDANGRPIDWVVTVPSTSGLVNGYENGYKWTLTLWWSESNSVTSFETFFETQTTPTISINSFSDPVLSKTIDLSATYTSNSNVPIMWFKWILAENDDGSTLVRQTSEIRGSARISFFYDGLKTNSQYKVKCIAKNQAGITIESGWVPFSVSYPVVEYNGVVEVSHADYNSIKIDISNTQFIEGIPTPVDGYKIRENYPVEGYNSCQIEADAEILYQGDEQFPLDINDDAVFAFCVRLRGDGDVLKIESIDGAHYRMLIHEGTVDGLPPSEELVPYENLAPQDGDAGQYRYTVNGIDYIVDTALTNDQWHLFFLRNNGVEMIGLGDIGGAADWS